MNHRFHYRTISFKHFFFKLLSLTLFYSSYLFSTHIFVLDGVLCFIASMLISSEYHSFSLSSVFYHLYHGMHTHTHTHTHHPKKKHTTALN